MKAVLKKFHNPAFEFFNGIFSTYKCSYFCFFCMCWPFGANTWMWDICVRATSAVCNSILSHWNLHIIRQNGSHANSSPERSIHTMKQRIYLIYFRIWVLRLVCGCQVFCEHLNSNSVFKLFILIWSYEGMKVMNFGFVKSNGNLSTMLKFNVFIMLV